MKNLISVIYVSTAYSNADLREINETIYSMRIKPHTMIDICDNLNDETISRIEKELIGKHPNTYTLSKNLAEQILLSNGNNLPITIVRPSIVCAAYQDPFPGWIDNKNSVTGLTILASNGFLRSMICNEDLVTDLVPVDYVIDTLICAYWHNVTQRISAVKVYNCTAARRTPSDGVNTEHY